MEQVGVTVGRLVAKRPTTRPGAGLGAAGSAAEAGGRAQRRCHPLCRGRSRHCGHRASAAVAERAAIPSLKFWALAAAGRFRACAWLTAVCWSPAYRSASAPRALNFHLLVIFAALAIGVAAYPIVRQLTGRLERLQRGVDSLGAGDLGARVAVEGHDEIAGLAESFNRAATQIEQLIHANRSLLANASHELRTPLARIRLAVEMLKQSADPKTKAGLEQDIAELDGLVDEILLASRLGHGCAERCARGDRFARPGR